MKIALSCLTAALAGASLALANPAGAATTTGPSAAPAAAPSAAASLPLLSAQQIVERNIAARGGLKAWRAVRSISYQGSLDAGRARPDNGLNPSAQERPILKPGKPDKPGQRPEDKANRLVEGTPVSLPYTLYMERPNKQRVELKLKDETLVQVYDGKNGWKLQPYLHRGVLPFSQQEMAKARQFQDIDGPLVDYAAKGTQVAVDGTDVIDGRPAYRLKLTLKSGDTRRLWVDGATFLDVQIDGSRHFNGHEVAQYTVMSDFRKVDGVTIPYRMQTRTDGVSQTETIQVEKVALNPPLPDSLFGKPD